MALPIAANIITGFLGSGKTTLIRHVLHHGLKNERVAVIMNEMAELGIDGKVLQGVNVDRIVELNNGCICCSGILQLGIAVQEIVDTVNPTLLLIESSGVAEVTPLVGELRGIGLRTDSVITVVDAENIFRHLNESASAVDQIENADFLLLNKTDLIRAAELEKAERKLTTLNGRALIFRSQYGAIDTDLLFACSARRYRELTTVRQDPEHAHPSQDGFESFVYMGPGSLSREAFERFVRELPAQIIRSKGIIHFAGEYQPSLFNYVCGRYSLAWFSAKLKELPEVQLVFIGRHIKRFEDTILKSLGLCRAPTQG